jgi:hypothetical protein
MRKWVLGLSLIMALTLFFALPAMAQSYMLDKIYASVEVPDTYTVITPDNAASYAEWLQGRGENSEDVTNDLIKRGVLLQCWSSDSSICLEVTATQSDLATNVFDINEQSTSVRAQYRLSHFPDNDFVNDGYEFSSADWKNTDAGRFLILRYAYRENGQLDHRGLMRRTIRNGYEITFDMKVFGRSITNKDNTALNKLWDTFRFIQVQPLPAAASAKINITNAPPKETNDATFTFEGTASKGVAFTAVVMGLSSPDPVVFKADVGASGKFKLPLELPKEGVFMVTITADYQGEDIMELAYPVTYQRTLLTVDVSTVIPTAVTSDTLTVQGNSTPGALIQAFVNDELVVKKKVNTAGKFSIDLDTSKEGSYTLVLAFSKNGLADRRVTYTFSRQWAETDMLTSLAAQAIKPAYATLVDKISGYDGRIMGYKCYVVDITQSGDSWILKLALVKNAKGYKNIILAVTDSEPDVKADDHVMMYGQCAGMSLPENDTSTDAAASSGDTYPTFDLLLISEL